jgi:hypothetical protein
MIQIFRTLNLSLFDGVKKKVQYHQSFSNANLTVRSIQKAFHPLKQTIVENSVKNAFTMHGFEITLMKTLYVSLLREEKLRQSQGFRDIWDADYPIDKLSETGRKAQYRLTKARRLNKSFVHISAQT